MKKAVLAILLAPLLLVWVSGISMAKSYVLVVLSVLCPPYAAYLFLDKLIRIMEWMK